MKPLPLRVKIWLEFQCLKHGAKVLKKALENYLVVRRNMYVTAEEYLKAVKRAAQERE